MSKQMNSPQSDGIVLAEEASFSDAARVKGPHRKTSSTMVDLKLMEGSERRKFGFFNDAGNLSLWHYRFEFSGSFIIRSPKEIT